MKPWNLELHAPDFSITTTLYPDRAAVEITVFDLKTEETVEYVTLENYPSERQLDKTTAKLKKKYTNAITVSAVDNSEKCDCGCGEWLSRVTTWDDIFNREGKKLIRNPPAITLPELAKALRNRLVKKGLVPKEVINQCSDLAIIESYLKCNCCNKMALPLNTALNLMESCLTADEWLTLTQQKGIFH